MTRRLHTREGTHLALGPKERHVLQVERDLLPYWAALGVVGMGFVAYGLYDPVYGWGAFFLGIVAMSFIGGAITSIRYHVTDQRLVRTGYLGVADVPLRGARIHLARSRLLGHTLTVENGPARLRVRFVRDAEAVAHVLRQTSG